MIDTGSGLPKAITPTDNQNLGMMRGIYVGVTGDVAVYPYGGGAAVVHKAMGVGQFQMLIQGIASTGTTATNIVGYF